MTKSTGQRSSSARMRDISATVRELHKDKRLKVRRKHQAGAAEPTIYLITKTASGANRWLPLTSTLRSRDGLILEEIKQVLEDFKRSEEQKPLPITTDRSLATYRRLALHSIQSEKVTEKTIQRKASWINRLVSWIESTGQRLMVGDEEVVRSWVAQYEPNSRSRREALSAAVTLWKAAFDGKVFRYEDLKTAREVPKPRPQHLNDEELIRLLRRVYEEDPAVGVVRVWAALTGQRLSTIVCSEWSHGLNYPIEIGVGINAWCNKSNRTRAEKIYPLWPALLEEFTEGELRFVPSDVARFRGPWDRPSDKDQQKAFAEGNARHRNWINRHIKDPTERDALTAQVLRHRAGQRILDRGGSVAECAHWLGTSTQVVEARYSSSWRLRLDQRAQALFAEG